MTTRRDRGEGSIYKRGDGRWCASVRFLNPDSGERERLTVYGKTKTEVRQKLKAAVGRIEAGAPPRDATMRVGAWMKEWREVQLKASSLKPTTKSLYSSLSKKHLEPAWSEDGRELSPIDHSHFGRIPLDRLRPSHVDKLILELRAKKLAPSTVRQIYHVLRLGLDGAVRDRLIARNPCDSVKRPGAERTEARHLPAADVAALLHAAEGSRYHALLELIARTGIRRGEALALKWSDVDFESGVLRIRGTLARVDGDLTVIEPKSAKSRRTLPLSPAVVARLKWQRASQERERKRAANLWVDQGFVFTTETGSPVDGRNLLRVVKSAAKKAGLGSIGVHTLRHSAATAMLENGVHLKAVSELLGHSSISITGDVYAHVSPETARTAMESLSEAIGQ